MIYARQPQAKRRAQAEYYKAYQQALAPRLLAMYQNAQEVGILLDALRESLLVSLPKPNRNVELMGSYGPLALLNADYKLLAKILAHRLAPLVLQLVHADQNAFVPACSTSLNLQCFFRVAHYSRDS